jgi:thioesterase domain-containing protein
LRPTEKQAKAADAMRVASALKAGEPGRLEEPVRAEVTASMGPEPTAAMAAAAAAMPAEDMASPFMALEENEAGSRAEMGEERGR